ncbi:MAG: hypothetical protein DWQ02_28195, partial [Bacteroidetes bacterium]
MHNILFTSAFILLFISGTFGQTLFYENFEEGLANWNYQEPGIAQIIETEDSTHKSVLKLTPNRSAECVLVKDSDQWDKIVIKGEALFPTELHDYLGLVYKYHEADRTDFGC